MHDEYSALIQRRIWQLVPPSPSHNVIRCKWVFKTKMKSDGSIEWYKAILVAKGYHQRLVIDFIDTFSPIVKTNTIRLLLSLAATCRLYIITKLDISNAFLHEHLD